MNLPKKSVTAFIVLTIAIFLPSFTKADEKKVLCFVAHKTSHGFGKHEYFAGCHLMGDWLAETYPGKIESRYSIGWPTDEDKFFKGADSVIFFCTGGGRHLVLGHEEKFDKLMKTGAGIACFHYGVEITKGTGGQGMLNWMGGYFETHWSVNPHWIAEFNVYPDHPAANGLKPFKSDDEWYFHMRFKESMKGVTPILSAIAPAETMKRKDGAHSGNPTVRKAVAAGKPQHVAWAYQRGKDYRNGRGFGFTGLHYHHNWKDDNFRKCVLNGIAWTAQLEIPKNGIEVDRPTQEFLDANAFKYGGAQGRKPPTKK